MHQCCHCQGYDAAAAKALYSFESSLTCTIIEMKLAPSKEFISPLRRLAIRFFLVKSTTRRIRI